MLTIGLTGGIGSGKSTVADLFEKLGVEIIDSDRIAHELTTPHSDCSQAIAAHFGDEILNADHSINRTALKEKIFNQAHEREWLEQLLHPKIIERMQSAMRHARGHYCIAVVPLLVEKKLMPLFDRILVVDSSEELQQQRTITRDHSSQMIVEKIIRNQCDRATRLQHADDVIHNDGSLHELQQQVTRLHQQYSKT